jgi:hypothetical protein
VGSYTAYHSNVGTLRDANKVNASAAVSSSPREASAMTLQVAGGLLALEYLAQHGVLDDITEVGRVHVRHQPTR